MRGSATVGIPPGESIGAGSAARRALRAALAALVAAAMAPAAGAASGPDPGATTAAGPSRAATPDCPPGEPIQWMADACMAALQTDDVIAASDCIERERRLRFPDACAAKVHFKRRLCETLAAGDADPDRLATCLADPRFHGRTVAAAGPATPSLPPLPPVDEAAAQPDFLAFRARLQAALARHDAAALLAAVHPDIRNSFGGDDGIAAFRERWRPEAPDSPVWTTLAEVLSLGGLFDAEGRFVAPYVFSAWPADVDAFEHVAVLGRGVRVRAAPHAGAEPLALLDFAIVRLQPDQPDAGWSAVRLADGRRGFVHRRLVRSPVDYRAAFEKSHGGWKMTLFLAGD